MSTHTTNARRLSTVEVVESYLLDHLEGAWPDATPTAYVPSVAAAPAVVDEALCLAQVSPPIDLIVDPPLAAAPVTPSQVIAVPATPVADPDQLNVICFLVGPFRFLCPVEAVLEQAPDLACSVVIDAVELVPAPYRAQAAASQQLGRDVVWLKGGRLEIRGCRLDPTRAIRRSDLRSRGPRAEAPWIGATLRDPPAFFLDSDAMQLHFMRRLRVGD